MTPRGMTHSDMEEGTAAVPLFSGMSAPETLQLALTLQTTLEPKQLLALFAKEVQALVPHDGLHYREPVRGIDLSASKGGRHRCRYQLTLLGEALGELTISRRRKFTDEELVHLEHLLCFLPYPLRNTLRYQDALRAAQKDPLTGIGNRAALDETLNRAIHIARRRKHQLALVAIDVDYFKRLNDTHGHHAGDCALKAVAERMAQAMRASDSLFRYGGEEFVALLEDTDAAGAARVAERIRQTVADTVCHCDEKALQVTVSLGIAMLESGHDAKTLFDNADHALYRAKKNGRNRVELHSAD